MTRIIAIMALVLALAAPAWGAADCRCVNGEIFCYDDLIPNDRFSIESCPPNPVSTEPGPWQCYKDEFGIIQCSDKAFIVRENILFVRRDILGKPLDDLSTIPEPGKCYTFHEQERRWVEIDCKTNKPILLIEVPDMNGDGQVNDEDKFIAERAIQEYREMFLRFQDCIKSGKRMECF